MIECGWWCPYCASAVPGDHVTYNRRHDYKSGGCGGRVHETSTPITDNTAVIRALEKRVEELEKVAEAAEATYKIYFWDGTKPLNHWEREYNALRAAGYLGGGE